MSGLKVCGMEGGISSIHAWFALIFVRIIFVKDGLMDTWQRICGSAWRLNWYDYSRRHPLSGLPVVWSKTDHMVRKYVLVGTRVWAGK